MYLIGLTGGIASGKSVVAKRLAGHGAVHIDADGLAREVVEPGTPALAAIAERFSARGRWRERLPTILGTLVAIGRIRADGKGRYGTS